MSHLLNRTIKYTLAGGFLATSIWATAVYRESSKIDRRRLATSGDVSQTFERSAAHRLFNPRQFGHTTDSRWIKIEVSSDVKKLQPQILVWLLNGFFQSWVFAPEELVLRSVLRPGGRMLVRLSPLPQQPPEHIWHSSHLAQSSLPPLHTILFGTFQVVDIWRTTTEGGVDVAWGSDRGTLSGCHRLAVALEEDEGRSYLCLSLSCMSCNPTEGERKSLFRFPMMLRFHEIYAEHLFRAAVGNVVSNLEASGVTVHI